MPALAAVGSGPPLVRGPLALFPLFPGDSPSDDGPVYIPGPLALDAGILTVEDSGDVPTLVVENAGDVAVLLVQGEMLLGAKQNRTVTASLLCGRGRTKIPVACVERGRWGNPEHSRRSQRNAPPTLRRLAHRSVSATPETRRHRHADQGAVWATVGGYADKTSTFDETEASRRRSTPPIRWSSRSSTGRLRCPTRPA